MSRPQKCEAVIHGSQDGLSVHADMKQERAVDAPPPAKKKPSTRRKVNMACIYCRRSHMTCDENRPCQRCIKRDIGHLCRNESTTSSTNGGRTRSARKQTATATPVQGPPPPPVPVAASTSNTMISPYAIVNMNQVAANRGVLPQDTNGSSAASSTTVFPLDHSLAHSTHSPNFSSGVSLSSNPAFDTGLLDMTFNSSTGSDISLMTPQTPSSSLSKPNQTDVDSASPLFRQLQTFTATPPSSSENVAVDPFSEPAPTQTVFGAQRESPSRTDSDKASLPTQMLGAQLGGTAWLGLGGTSQQTGDAGGGSELDTLNEFLNSLDDDKMLRPNEVLPLPFKPDDPMISTLPFGAQDPGSLSNTSSSVGLSPSSHQRRHSFEETLDPGSLNERSMDLSTSAPSLSDGINTNPSSTEPLSTLNRQSPSKTTDSKTERFLLTAADQTDGSRNERLQQVIRAKWETGLLRPFNHVHGYARLNEWMEKNVSPASRRRILRPLSVFKPVFIALSKSLTNYDLICVEEAFERLLLDYDRVFSIQGIPACLWRRTGEIYKGNKEFSELVGMPIQALRDGRLCIYELMAEESAVNYWEKYGSVCFDSSQKAVLTMCTLKTRNKSLGSGFNRPSPSEGDISPQDTQNTDTDSSQTATSSDEAVKNTSRHISCCFSFTIRRDKWNVRMFYLTNAADSHHDCWRTCTIFTHFTNDITELFAHAARIQFLELLTAAAVSVHAGSVGICT